MNFDEMLNEKYSKGKPVVCVDVQPAYMKDDAAHLDYRMRVAQFLAGQKGPIMMYVNADETSMTEDNIEHDIYPFWDEAFQHLGYEPGAFFESDTFARMQWFDKGYGYLRGWIDYHIDNRVIVQVVREMYKQKVTDSRQLFGGDEDKLVEFVREICGGGGHIHRLCPTIQPIRDEPIQVGWLALDQLKRYNNCYLIGGGREECLKEVAILMNAFNIKYTAVDGLIYG